MSRIFRAAQDFTMRALPLAASVAVAGLFAASGAASVEVIGSNVYMEYRNGTPKDGSGGPTPTSTIAQYSAAGRLPGTSSVIGHHDGLRYNAPTGMPPLECPHWPDLVHAKRRQQSQPGADHTGNAGEVRSLRNGPGKQRRQRGWRCMGPACLGWQASAAARSDPLPTAYPAQ